jgi:hypothetical protein
LNLDTYERLPKTKVATLVMHGKKDILVPPENARIIADRIPSVRLVYFENSGHPFFSQEPEKVNKAVLDFLNNLSSLSFLILSAVENGKESAHRAVEQSSLWQDDRSYMK